MGFGNSALSFFGGDGRDDDAAKKALATTNQQQGQAFDNYGTANQANLSQNTALANTNYYGNAAQVYGQQQNAASMLQAQANGTAPSAAEIQMGLGLGQANQQAQASALSQQGGVLSGNTQRNMLNAQAMNSQNVLGQTGALRAQEQLSGQQQYANMLTGMQNQQQQQGKLNYDQGQNALTNSMTLNQQNFKNAQDTSAAKYGNSIGEINHEAQATTAATAGLRSTAAGIGAAIATGGASGMLGGVASGAMGAIGSSKTSGLDPNTGAQMGYTQDAQGNWNKTS